MLSPRCHSTGDSDASAIGSATDSAVATGVSIRYTLLGMYRRT